MLGFVEGKVISKNADTAQCIVLAQSVGYEVSVPRHVFDTVNVEEETRLWIHTHVREEALTLYGFGSEQEKHFFRVLLGMSGLGPQKAMGLLAEHGARNLVDYILKKDIDALSEAPGVGKKLAQKIVLELQSKVEKLGWVDLPAKPIFTTENPSHSGLPQRQLHDDLSSALENLGYHATLVKTTLDKMFERDEDELSHLGFETCFKNALSEMARR